MDIHKPLTAAQIVNEFLPYMGWCTDKADDAGLIEECPNEIFTLSSSVVNHDTKKISNVVFESPNGVLVFYFIEDAKLNGMEVRVAAMRIADVHI